MDWMLTDEEKAQFIQFPVEGYTSDRDGLCQAQAKKLVEWLDTKGLLKHHDVWTKRNKETCEWVCLADCQACGLCHQVGL